MTQYTDSAELNGLTFSNNYFYNAVASASETDSNNGSISYSGTVVGSDQATIAGTISSSGNGYFTVASASGTTTMYQVLGSTADGRNLVFEAAQNQGSNSGPYYILSGSGTSPGTTPLDYSSTNAYTAPAPVCFAAGTRIMTPTGEIAVEDLAIGNMVLTAAGKMRPIVWTGKAHIHAAAHPRVGEINPILIRCGALGDGIPRCDLRVSPGHRLLIDGCLYQAALLVNEATIVQEPVKTIVYHHIELDSPDAVLAEGAAAESYVDVGNRGAFRDAIGLPSAPALIDADPLTETFAPTIKCGPKLDAVRAALLDRALAAGWSRNIDRRVAIEVAGRRFDAAAIVGGRHWFILPEAAEQITLVSRAAVCSIVKPGSGDDRLLGVQVLHVSVDGHQQQLYSPVFGRGFHDCEDDEDGLFRWTNGSASLALRKPGRVIEVVLGRGAEVLARGCPEVALVA